MGSSFRDQLAETGHADRVDDFDLLASLGLDAVRFPVLWERVSPTPASEPDWNWSDDRLQRLQRRGIRPIAGLIHHGSGPAHTSLLDEGFAAGLAAHAARVVRRYPWIAEWTPVNEPLTTARFSALYGVWYPHARDERSFWLALLNQVDATRLSMRAIREVHPDAQLIQTEDLGRTYATIGIAEQAAFDNQRRWMTWDLLCGKVDRRHPLWPRLTGFGFAPRLNALLDDPCPPEVIGINHYLTSDRLLDQRTAHYPACTVGGNDWAQFADVEAVRVLRPGPQGLRGAIDEAWQRYRIPIAITEVHNGCTREEQTRWLSEAWATAGRARERGIDLRAVTAWALFGSQGWNTLLRERGTYEPGAFDTSSGEPRATSVAAAVRRRGPRTAGRPWWRRDARLIYPATPRPAAMADLVEERRQEYRQPLLIVGASGTLGQALARECRSRDIAYVLTGRDDLDLHDPDGAARAIDRFQPWAVVNAAGWVRVDDAEDSPEACRAANTEGARTLSRACADAELPSVNFSSDLVFGAPVDAPLDEADTPSPINVYGRSKHEMEESIEGMRGRHLIVRTAAFFSPHDAHNFAVHCVNALRDEKPFAAASDCIVSPTYVPDLCRAALDLLIDGETGIWHLTNHEAVSWIEFAERIAQARNLKRAGLTAAPAAELGWKAPRPSFSALASRRGAMMPSLQSAVDRFAEAGAAA